MLSLKVNLLVNIRSQTLIVNNAATNVVYPIATAKKGIGQIENSECTPLGMHRVAEKIGANMPTDAVFIGREWTKEIYTESLAQAHPDRDWILTRILWLDGQEQGTNKGMSSVVTGASCDSKNRYIYIHGCPDSHAMQIPSSHGCIKMRNADIIQLFDMVEVGTAVSIITE